MKLLGHTGILKLYQGIQDQEFTRHAGPRNRGNSLKVVDSQHCNHVTISDTWSVCLRPKTLRLLYPPRLTQHVSILPACRLFTLLDLEQIHCSSLAVSKIWIQPFTSLLNPAAPLTELIPAVPATVPTVDWSSMPSYQHRLSQPTSENLNFAMAL